MVRFVLVSFFSFLVFSTSSAASIGFFVNSEISSDQKWVEKQCRLLTRGAQFYYGNGKKIPCEKTQKLPLSNDQLIIDAKYDINLLLWEDIGGDFHLYISNIKPKDPTDFKHEEWKFNLVKNLNWKTDVVKLTTNAVIYAENLKYIKQQYLNIGMQAGSNRVAEKNGKYINAETGEQINFDVAYALYTTEGPQQKNYMLLALEISLLLAGGTDWYYKNHDFNIQDAQFNSDSKHLWKRFTDLKQIRMDDNDAAINRKHINAGTAYCLSARIAGFNKYECLLTAIVSSAFWEYVVEYREVMSINDQIVTPMAGFVFGNAIAEMGKKFYEKYNAPIARVLSAIFGSSQSAQRWLANYAPPQRINIRDYGFDPDAFNYFDAGVLKYTQKTSSSEQKDSGTMWYVDSEILEIPLGPGSTNQIMDPNFVRVDARGTLSSKQAMDLIHVAAKIGFTGKYIQNIQKTEDGYLNGYNILLIPGSGAEILNDQNSSGGKGMARYNEMIVNVNLLGATARINGYYKNFHFQAEVEGYGDFAMVKSYSLEEYAQTHDLSGVSSLVRSQGYYYAGGVTGALNLKMGYRKSEVGVKISQDRFTNILDGRSRNYETETESLDMNDMRLRQQLYVKLVTTLNLKFNCAVERTTRQGSVEKTSTAKKIETFQSCGIAYSFW